MYKETVLLGFMFFLTALGAGNIVIDHSSDLIMQNTDIKMNGTSNIDMNGNDLLNVGNWPNSPGQGNAENLNSTLEAGNIANQTIDMAGNDIINVGNLGIENGDVVESNYTDPNGNEVLLGDSNLDGKLTSRDAANIIRYSQGLDGVDGTDICDVTVTQPVVDNQCDVLGNGTSPFAAAMTSRFIQYGLEDGLVQKHTYFDRYAEFKRVGYDTFGKRINSRYTDTNGVPVLLGDSNRDGQLTPEDPSNIIRYSQGLDGVDGDPICQQNVAHPDIDNQCDVTGDGNVGPYDAAVALNFINSGYSGAAKNGKWDNFAIKKRKTSAFDTEITNKGYLARTNADTVILGEDQSGISCDSSKEGAVRYNGNEHQGCDGSTWKPLY